MAHRYTIWEWVGILLIVLLVLNIAGFALNMITSFWFWIVIAIVAWIAYRGLPRWVKR